MPGRLLCAVIERCQELLPSAAVRAGLQKDPASGWNTGNTSEHLHGRNGCDLGSGGWETDEVRLFVKGDAGICRFTKARRCRGKPRPTSSNIVWTMVTAK